MDLVHPQAFASVEWDQEALVERWLGPARHACDTVTRFPAEPGSDVQWQVQLFVREHHNGCFSIEVIGEPGLCVYADDLEHAREDLELLLSDRFERLHPRNAGRYAVADGLTLHEVVLPEALLVHEADEPAAVPTRVSVLMSRRRRWLRLWMPRWQLHYWVPSDQDPVETVTGFLAGHVRKLTEHQRLGLRWQGKEWLETLEVSAERPPLSAFTEKYLGVDMLPEPAPKEDDKDGDEDDDDEPDATNDTRPRGRKRKKKPPTPTLKRIGVPMSQLAKDEELERAFGREREVDELLAMLGAPGATGFVVVGESGVGKTTVLAELVYRLRARSSPKSLRARHVWFADASRLIAGDGWFGDWQRQCLDVIQECIDADVIWYIGDVLALLDAGKSIGSDQNVALLLRPFLSGKRITVVGECTPRQWSQIEQRDTGFARTFATYRLDEPAPGQARTILAAVARSLEEELDVSIEPGGLDAVEELCARYGSDKSLLGTSIHFLRRLFDSAAGDSQRENAAVPGRDERQPLISRVTVVESFCAQTGMPAFLVRDDLPMDPQSVHLHFRRRLIGQEEAVQRMTDLVAMIKAGLADVDRPLGSFLFVGPTGVGKTEMAKALTEFLFGRRDRLLRFDMSEFVSPDSVHRFIGDGGQEGQLISMVRRAPFCVLLLDEIEKAHPAVFDVLLQVLGEARLTDHAGRTADFRNTVVLMTSNLGVDTFKARAGFQTTVSRSFRDHFEAEAQRFFRPEFLNRIDYVVPFEPLQRQAIDAITQREIEKFLAREGITQRRLEVVLGPAVAGWLAARGVDPKYGARPLKRLLERSLSIPLARHLSEHASPAIAVTCDRDQLQFEGQASGRKPIAVALGELSRFIDRVRLVRYRIQKWRAAEPYHELRHSIRLLDRLSQDRNFWKDPAWAERRLRDCEPRRTLLREFDELYDNVASLEDLAFEARYDRNPESLPLLQAEFALALETLDRVELQLYGQRFSRADRATLLLQASSDGAGFLAELIGIYGALAGQHGWSIRGLIAQEDHKTRMERKQRQAWMTTDERRKKARARRERVNEDRAAWSWHKHEAHLTERAEDEDDDAFANRVERFRYALAADRGGELLALQIQGPHVACLLSAESGVHGHVTDQGSPQVKVHFLDLGGEGMPHPLDARAMFSQRQRRIVHEGKRTVQDVPLAINQALEPRLHKPYRRFMSAQMYTTVFGEGAYRLFRR